MQIIKYIFILIWLFNSSTTLLAQFHGFKEVSDSLIAKSYHVLYSDYYQSIDNIEASEIYATAFLKKAYLEKDTLNINNGYYMLTYHNEDRYMVFNDSLIKYSAYLPKEEANAFAWYAYQGKGSYYYNKRDFKKAFDNHINALNLTENNSELRNISTTNLGLLKERTGKNKAALIDFKENYRYESEKFKNLDSIDSISVRSFLNSMCLLANSYRLNSKHDSAQYISKRVFLYKHLVGSERYIGNTRVNSAEVHFELGNYQNTIDSINRALPLLIKHNNIANTAIAYYLRGMSKTKLNLNSPLEDLERMDSVFNLKNDLHPSLRPGYMHLIKQFKKNKNIPKQLYYVEQLLKFDSLVYDYGRHIENGIYIDETNDLQNTQRELKSEIDDINLKNRVILIVACFLVMLLLFEMVRRRKKNKKALNEYRVKFDKLVNHNKVRKDLLDINNLENSPTELNISESLVHKIVAEIEIFELKKGFLDKEISANKLAKEIGTNPNYLGQIIKHQYGKSFRQHINNLRIEYVLKAIREDHKMVNYSIQAIANEAGYNHAEPFSKAFKSKTGYYPSEFILKIKNTIII